MKKRSSKKSASIQHAKGGLNSEDALLWHRVTKTLRPIDKSAQNRTRFDSGENFEEQIELVSKGSTGHIIKGTTKLGAKKLTAKNQPISSQTPVISSEPPPLNQIEKRLGRRIAKGTPGFDARIDLHGMTQVEAHGALLRFLQASQVRGCRVALVITGKGRIGDDRDHFSMHEAPGVLRRNIRNWLEQPDFRTLVAAYAQAHRRHGGDGAIYVQIRRNRS